MEEIFFIFIDDHSSKQHEVTHWVPKGSILGPLLFNMYILPLDCVIRRQGISFHSYVVETQLNVAVCPNDARFDLVTVNFTLDIKAWFNSSLGLNICQHWSPVSFRSIF